MEEEKRHKLGKKALVFLQTFSVEEQHKVERDNLDASFIGISADVKIHPVQFDESRFWGVVDALDQARLNLTAIKFQELISIFRESPEDIMYRIEEIVQEQDLVDSFRKIFNDEHTFPAEIKTER